MKLQIKLLAFLALALLSIKSYSQSITITPAITQQSNTFKALSGSDRKTEFLSLQALFTTVASSTTCSGSTGATISTRTEVTDLFGTPSEVLSPNLIAYNLSTNGSSCRAEIGIDNSNRVIFITINNCP